MQVLLNSKHLRHMQQKKKFEQQRYELKQYLNLSFGPQAWNELLCYGR